MLKIRKISSDKIVLYASVIGIMLAGSAYFIWRIYNLSSVDARAVIAIEKPAGSANKVLPAVNRLSGPEISTSTSANVSIKDMSTRNINDAFFNTPKWRSLSSINELSISPSRIGNSKPFNTSANTENKK